MTTRDLEKRTYVVTGGNTGIGLATVRALVRRGGKVVLACRNRDKTVPVIEALEREIPGAELAFVELDLASLADVRRSVERLTALVPRIDVLVNNAGLVGARSGATRDGFELNFGVNHLGHFLFTTLLMPHLEASAPARVVNVASRAHLGASGIDFDSLRRPTRSRTGFAEYSTSKLCNILFTRSLAKRLDRSKVTAYSLHPGVIASDLWRGVPSIVRPLFTAFMKSNEQGAETSLYCATSAVVSAETGLYYDECRSRLPSRVAQDDALADALWTRSEAWVQS